MLGHVKSIRRKKYSRTGAARLNVADLAKTLQSSNRRFTNAYLLSKLFGTQPNFFVHVYFPFLEVLSVLVRITVSNPSHLIVKNLEVARREMNRVTGDVFYPIISVSRRCL